MFSSLLLLGTSINHVFFLSFTHLQTPCAVSLQQLRSIVSATGMFGRLCIGNQLCRNLITAS
jgi:hypothetical protein